MASTAAKPRHLTYAEARAHVLGAVQAAPPERVPLAELHGRVLREAIAAPHDLPPFANSSMDGYAVRRTDLLKASERHPVELPVSEVVPAGRVASRALEAGHAMRIMTGASIPEGADAVVPVEDVERFDLDSRSERVRFRRTPEAHESIRDAGRDIRAGQTALEAGREVSAHDIGLLASLGVTHAMAGPVPRVAILSTGDELLNVGDALRPGAIRDSNTPMLAALVEDAGGRVVEALRAGDDARDVGSAITELLAKADVVLSIGGVSAGDFDPVKESLDALGGIELWRVAMKPGRPQAFGAPGGTLFFGLPGNPGSVACVFEALVRPALRKWIGHANVDRPKIRVRAAADMPSREGRTDFVRARLALKDGDWWATPAGDQVSGHVTPQAWAHVLAIVPESAAGAAKGDALEAWLLRWPEAGA